MTTVDGPALERTVIPRLRKVGWMSAVSGAAVTFAAVALFIPVLGLEHQQVRLAMINLPLLVAYVALAGVVVRRRFRSQLHRHLAWLREGRPPSDGEHRCTLRLPARAAALDAIAWTLAGVLFALVNGLVQGWELAAVVAATIWLGGEMNCALGYQLYERALRRVTARALAVRAPADHTTPGVRMRLTMAWMLGTGVPLVGVLVASALVAFGWLGHPRAAGAAILFIAAVGIGTGLLTIGLAARAIADPLRALREAMAAIEDGDLDGRVAIDDGSEVGRLAAGFNRMADGLVERRRIRDLFGRQVGEEVARAALEEGTRLGGEEREVAVLFIDIVASTSLALELAPTELVSLLNRFFAAVIDVVEAEHGLVNKFEGDAALCVFGAPVDVDNPAEAALRAGRRLAQRLWRDLPELDFGIGVSAGLVVAGNIGSEVRYEYTVIGDPVNEAARLSELARGRPERVLASDAALQRASDAEGEGWTVSGAETLRGRDAPTRIAHPTMTVSADGRSGRSAPARSPGG